MTQATDSQAQDRSLKAQHRTIWALGDYGSMAAQLIPELGELLVDACGVRPRDRVLDVAAGTGNAAFCAAARGAQVVACDLTPELVDAGRQQGVQRGAVVEWWEADAEALPFEDEAFDVVLSCLGVMFAPHHATSARELLRVCRSGGRIGLVNWTPQGFIGQMFGVMKPYMPPPPPDALPPPLWGDEAHVRSLFEPAVNRVAARRGSLRVDMFEDVEAFVTYFKANYGPTIAAYRGIAPDADREAALDGDLRELAWRHAVGTKELVMEWEYLLLTAERCPH